MSQASLRENAHLQRKHVAAAGKARERTHCSTSPRPYLLPRSQNLSVHCASRFAVPSKHPSSIRLSSKLAGESQMPRPTTLTYFGQAKYNPRFENSNGPCNVIGLSAGPSSLPETAIRPTRAVPLKRQRSNSVEDVRQLLVRPSRVVPRDTALSDQGARTSDFQPAAPSVEPATLSAQPTFFALPTTIAAEGQAVRKFLFDLRMGERHFKILFEEGVRTAEDLKSIVELSPEAKNSLGEDLKKGGFTPFEYMRLFDALLKTYKK
ncbi:hypothetical protein EW146_g8265 [Bondarzewia mesenterica]|uniref:Uncharacterized protein n=1 Tax=Bondarzewia mesenterica TaxID=1095465 RepID=A0A4S4LFT6_9AGAM|nr:hypothetical protein EW146_g8265 [Bondarzewia mesenterica]